MNHAMRIEGRASIAPASCCERSRRRPISATFPLWRATTLADGSAVAREAGLSPHQAEHRAARRQCAAFRGDGIAPASVITKQATKAAAARGTGNLRGQRGWQRILGTLSQIAADSGAFAGKFSAVGLLCAGANVLTKAADLSP